MCSPGAGMNRRYTSFSVVTVQVIPSTPRSISSVIRTWHCSDWPQRTVRKGALTVSSRASSPLSTSSPSGRRFSKISHLALRIPSRLPRNSTWASPMLEMTAIFGRTISPR